MPLNLHKDLTAIQCNTVPPLCQLMYIVLTKIMQMAYRLTVGHNHDSEIVTEHWLSIVCYVD